MWLRNLTVFQADGALPQTVAELEAALAQAECPPCGKQTLRTAGFAPPLKQDSAMVQAVDGLVHARHREIVRLLPGPVVTEAVDARVDAIETEQERRVGRRERGEIKDQVIFELLPQAFTQSRYTAIVLDPPQQHVWVDSTSANRAEQVLTSLRDALGSLPVQPLDAGQDVAAQLTQWLRAPDTLPADLTLGDRCELRASDDSRAAMRCSAVDLHTDELRAHVDGGMQVKSLNLCWQDALEFDLDEQLTLKRLRPLDRINDDLEQLDADDAVAELQSRLALQGGVLRQLMQRLYPALGVQTPAAQAAA